MNKPLLNTPFTGHFFRVIARQTISNSILFEQPCEQIIPSLPLFHGQKQQFEKEK